MITSRNLQHIGHQFGGNGSTGLVFLVLAGIGEIGDDGGDTARGGSFAGGDHYQKFHYAIIDVSGGGGLKDENCRE